MKNLLALIGVSIFSTVFLTQCKKEDCGKDFNTNFYTSTANTQMWLYVDDVYKGELPYMATVPECSANYGDGTPPLAMTLKTGRYKITGKNAQGVVVSDAIVTIRTNGVGGSGKIGGNRVDSRGDDCLAIGLFE